MEKYYQDLIANKNIHKVLDYIYFNKNIVEKEKAVVSVAAVSLQYGLTAFAGIRGYYRDGEVRIFRLKDHHERLMNGSKILNFGYYIPYNEFEAIITDLVKKNNHKGDVYFRPFLMCDYMSIPPYKLEACPFDLSIYMLPMGDFLNSKGLNLKISSYHKFEDSSISTKAKSGGSYINNFLIHEEVAKDYDDAIVLDRYGNVIEANTANLMISYRDEILVPNTGSSALEGITIRSVRELLTLKGLTIRETQIDRSMLLTANEVLVTGTAAKIGYANTIDNRPIGVGRTNTTDSGPGEIATLAREEFDKVLNLKHELSSKWLTRITL